MGRGWFQQARILAASLSLAWPAGAADGAETEDAATRLFREGRALLRDGRVDEACEKLRASLELKRSPGTLLNVASCDRSQGNLLAAVAGFEAARSEARDHPETERRRLWIEAADEALQELRPRLAEIRLTLPSGQPPPPSWGVRLDGEPLALSDGRAPQNPGKHHLEVSAEGHRPYARDVQLAEGEHLTLELQLAPELPSPLVAGAPPVEAPIDQPPPPEQATPLLPVVLAVSGGVLTVAGLTFGVVTWQRKNDLDASCPGPSCPEGEVEDAERMATVADVLVVSGVVLGVAGGAWLLWGQSSEPSARVQASCWGTSRCRASLTLTF
ncbi:MAG TPA: hypothetical protein VNN80_18510 [Polyangiaceae bacterium]|nr:hypothetical protein [Polyangiaceae bacterium]